MLIRIRCSGSRLGYKTSAINRLPIEIFAGADNLLDQTYSLGNDLNAFGGRYFNAAPARNYYAGIRLDFKVKQDNLILFLPSLSEVFITHFIPIYLTGFRNGSIEPSI
ncbi:MAG: hypothetical protein U5K54_11265 [Cytophagales bacterium]|nr:hypothetical protein [Cytophagales bacterium]